MDTSVLRFWVLGFGLTVWGGWFKVSGFGFRIGLPGPAEDDEAEDEDESPHSAKHHQSRGSVNIVTSSAHRRTLLFSLRAREPQPQSQRHNDVMRYCLARDDRGQEQSRGGYRFGLQASGV